MKTISFIDASNLFYGGEKILGWKIDYKKLLYYLKDKYSSEKIYYFGGVEIYDLDFDYLNEDTVDIVKLEKYLENIIKEKLFKKSYSDLDSLDKSLKRVKFYKNLESFGYIMRLKPVKIYKDENKNTKRKANCDVDMTFMMMKEKDNFDRALILSGDGDFIPVLNYLKKDELKEVLIVARRGRTAKEIRQFAANKFIPFDYYKNILEFLEG